MAAIQKFGVKELSINQAVNSTTKDVHDIMHNSSAVAEMGDRSSTINVDRKVEDGCCVPFGEKLGPRLTQCGQDPGPRPTSIPKLNGILIRPTVWPQYTNAKHSPQIKRLIG